MGKRKGPVYHNQPKSGAPKAAGQMLVSGIVLFIALVAGGIGYSLYSNNDQPVMASKPSTQIPSDAIQEIKPKPPATGAKEGVAVESFSSLAMPGTQSSISVKTLPDSTCKIAVLFNKTPVVDKDLAPQQADAFGTVTWTWTVGPDAPAGMWPINITCAYQKQSAVVQTTLDVSKP